MNLGDSSVAVLLEVVEYDLANGIAKAKSRTRPGMLIDVPISDSFAMCLDTKPGQIGTVGARRVVEVLIATKEWALVRQHGEALPFVVETCMIEFAAAPEADAA